MRSRKQRLCEASLGKLDVGTVLHCSVLVFYKRQLTRTTSLEILLRKSRVPLRIKSDVIRLGTGRCPITLCSSRRSMKSMDLCNLIWDFCNAGLDSEERVGRGLIS